MRRVTVWALFGAMAVLVWPVLAGPRPIAVPVATQPAPGGIVTAPVRGAYEIGEDLFFHETFAGNGRTCATCHDPRNEFAMSPQLAQQRYALDPTHPLFRPVDSDDGGGADYHTVLERALFNVNITLHPSVTLPDFPGKRTITVRRGVPSISNVAITGPYLADGRAAKLQDQAAGAIADHIQAARRVLPKELDALAAFETEMYYPLRLRAMTDASDPLPKPPGFSLTASNPSALRGKEQFDMRCRRCHDGETFDQPKNSSFPKFSSVFVSEVNKPGLPMIRLRFVQSDGTPLIVETPDPGRAATTGDVFDLNAFETPSLRGLKHTAPYFHDNSAATLEEVVDHYDDHFHFRMTLEEKQDLITFLELL